MKIGSATPFAAVVAGIAGDPTRSTMIDMESNMFVGAGVGDAAGLCERAGRATVVGQREG
jgi:hypothetical protein